MRLPLVTLQWNAKKIDKSNIFICYIYIIIPDISCVWSLNIRNIHVHPI